MSTPTQFLVGGAPDSPSGPSPQALRTPLPERSAPDEITPVMREVPGPVCGHVIVREVATYRCIRSEHPHAPRAHYVVKEA